MPSTDNGHVRHRGANSEDRRLFDDRGLPALREATADLSWLLGRGYSQASAVKIVGDRYGLHARQRIAVARASCSDAGVERRARSRVALADLDGQELLVDGFNLLITAEAALSGGVILQCRDGCYRDIASVHGSYRSVEETDRALEYIGTALSTFRAGTVTWVLDKPVSNSGRLKVRIQEFAVGKGWNWAVETAMSPDKVLMESTSIAVTSDSTILDNVGRWANVGGYIVDELLTGVWIVDLR